MINFLNFGRKETADEMTRQFNSIQQKIALSRSKVEALEKAAMDGEVIWFQPEAEEAACIIKTLRTGSMFS